MLTKRASIAVYYISTTLLRRCQYPKVDIPASVFYNIASDHVAALSKYGDNFPHDRLQYLHPSHYRTDSTIRPKATSYNPGCRGDIGIKRVAKANKTRVFDWFNVGTLKNRLTGEYG